MDGWMDGWMDMCIYIYIYDVGPESPISDSELGVWLYIDGST